MLASLAVLWISLVTVYMGGQLPQIAFLLIRLRPIDRTRTYGPGGF